MEKESENIKKYLRIVDAVEKDIREYQSYDPDVAFEKIERKMVISSRGKGAGGKQIFAVIAAVLLLLLIPASLLSYLYVKQNFLEEPVYHTITTAPGMISQFNLPDNSKVWLNAGSTLRYPTRFSTKKREVFLEGEGYFDVESNKSNPFYVSLNDNLRVKAYGTSFNISSYPDEPVVETVLETGMVDVRYGTQVVELHPGKSLSFDKENRKMELASVNAEEKTAWKDGWLVFRYASIDEVVKVLSRRYNIDIVLHTTPGKKYDFNFRGTFSTETITQILDYMKMAAPIEWSFVEAEQQQDSSFTKQRIDIRLK